MINPRLSKTSNENQFTLQDSAKKLFQVIYNDQNKKPIGEEVPKIKVSSFLSKMAFYYEKIRNSIDDKEEHLLRKNAIERILKREIVIQGSIKTANNTKVSKNILTELIRAGYLPNDSIPETKIDEIAIVIEKYLTTRDKYEQFTRANLKKRNNITNWILTIIASDIEERLRNNAVIDISIDQIYNTLVNKINLPDNSIYKEDREIQIYVSVYRKLLKFDDSMVSFILFKYYVREWDTADVELINKIAKNLDNLKEKIDYHVDHPIKSQINRITSSYAVFFNILADVIAENPNDEYKKAKTDHNEFALDITKKCEKKYTNARSRLWRAAFRSILYIFITKSVFVLLFEIPIIKWFGEEVSTLSLAINIGFPALLLFIIVLFSQVPSEANTKKIVVGIEEIIFEEKRKLSPITLRPPVKRGAFMNAMFGIIYSITFFSSFGFVIWALDKIHFNWVSTLIFLFFLAFVSFFSIRIRKIIGELRVIEPKETIFSFLVDFFYMPIVATGKFLSENFSRVNVFIFIMDFIMEAPFKALVEIVEEWAKYVKERREEIV